MNGNMRGNCYTALNTCESKRDMLKQVYEKSKGTKDKALLDYINAEIGFYLMAIRVQRHHRAPEHFIQRNVELMKEHIAKRVELLRNVPGLRPQRVRQMRLELR